MWKERGGAGFEASEVIVSCVRQPRNTSHIGRNDQVGKVHEEAGCLPFHATIEKLPLDSAFYAAGSLRLQNLAAAFADAKVNCGRLERVAIVHVEVQRILIALPGVENRCDAATGAGVRLVVFRRRTRARVRILLGLASDVEPNAGIETKPVQRLPLD